MTTLRSEARKLGDKVRGKARRAGLKLSKKSTGYSIADRDGNPIAGLDGLSADDVVAYCQLVRERQEIEQRASYIAPPPIEKRNADRIDGYDRDDLGESPDH